MHRNRSSLKKFHLFTLAAVLSAPPGLYAQSEQATATSTITSLLTTTPWRRDTADASGMYRIRHLSFSEEGVGSDVFVTGTRACLSSIRSRNCIMGPGSERSFSWSASGVVIPPGTNQVRFRLCITYDERSPICRASSVRLPTIQPQGPMILAFGAERWATALPVNTDAVYESIGAHRGGASEIASTPRMTLPGERSDERAAAESLFYEALYSRQEAESPSTRSATCSGCPSGIMEIVQSARSLGTRDARLVGRWANQIVTFALLDDGTMMQEVGGQEPVPMYWYQVRPVVGGKTVICIVRQPVVRGASGAPRGPASKAPFQCAESQVFRNESEGRDAFSWGKLNLLRERSR